MTDLISKVDKMVGEDLNAVQEIVNKYASILQGTLPEKNVPYIAYIIDICVQYLSGSHGASSPDWKTWATLLIKKSFEDGKLKNYEEIVPLIDEFLEYKENEYEKYCKNIISISDYDRDRGFFYKFYFKLPQ